jgi:hypothetical protein
MNKIPEIILMIITILIFSSCEKWIDPEINIDPDKPVDPAMGPILSALEGACAFEIVGGNDMQRFQSMWLQQIDGVGGVSLAESNYYIQPSSVSLIWNHAYTEVLMDARMLRDKAISENSPQYHGIALIMAAFTLGQMTDIWNDIPWSEALQGQENFQAKFDSQESIYEEIQDLLSEAIGDLNDVGNPGNLSGDFIYSGNVGNWLKAAHALKARYALHLSKRNGQNAYMDALDEVALSFTDNSEDMQFNWWATGFDTNPFFQFMDIYSNDIRMGAYFIELLKSYDDPRISVYAYPSDTLGNYSGSEPGSGNTQVSTPGPAVAAPDAPSYFITYAELLFIKAEAMLKTGQNEAEVKDVLVEAVTASLDKYGVMDSIWVTNYADQISSLAGDELFEEIMIQKYIATFYQPEAYHSWRRTGIPELTPNPSGATTDIPLRFPYPSSEQALNPNTPVGISITDPVWWDK